MRPVPRLAAVAVMIVGVLTAAGPRPALDLQEASRDRLSRLVVGSGLTDPARRLVGVQFVCTLTVGRERFGVIDLREVVPKAGAPGGVNRVVLLGAADRLTASFDYGIARPIACRGNRLLLFGDADPRHDGTGGDVIVYGPHGRIADVLAVDAAALWPAS